MSGAPVSGTMGQLQLLTFTNAGSAEAIRTAAGELGFKHTRIETGNVIEATAFLKENASPEILLVEILSADEAPAHLDALADFVNPLTKVLVTGKVDSIRFYQWLSDLGIDGYLLQPFTSDELKQAIAKGAVKRAAAQEEHADNHKKIVAVVGARGGVGTTTIATNLASLFALEHHKMTAIVDLDPYFGSVALGLDLEAGRGLRDAFEKPDRVDALFLERVMIKPFNELSVLSGEEPLVETINAQANAGEMIFGALREKFSIIVVDLPRQMSPLTRHVMSIADHVLIVAEPQITSLRDSLRIKDYLVDQLKRPTPLLIMNRVGISPTNELPQKEFAKNYGHDVAAQFAYMHEVIAATAQGDLLNSVPKLKTLLAPLRALAQSIIGVDEEEDEETATGGSLLTRLLGKK